MDCGTQVERKSRTSQLSPYCFYYFGSSSHEKVKDVWAITMLFIWIWVLKSRQSGGRLSYKGTFSIALDTQVKRKCRTSQLLSYFSKDPWVKSGLFWLRAPSKKLTKNTKQGQKSTSWDIFQTTDCCKTLGNINQRWRGSKLESSSFWGVVFFLRRVV